MNACLQCLIPIEELRDYFINGEFSRYRNKNTLSNSNDYCKKFQEFLVQVYSADSDPPTYLNPTLLKNLVRKKFFPLMQHDSHEFLMHIMSQL